MRLITIVQCIMHDPTAAACQHTLKTSRAFHSCQPFIPRIYALFTHPQYTLALLWQLSETPRPALIADGIQKADDPHSCFCRDSLQSHSRGYVLMQ